MRPQTAGRQQSCEERGVEGRTSAEFLERYAALTPSRRMLREDEVVQPILFLLDDGSSSVVGASMNCMAWTTPERGQPPSVQAMPAIHSAPVATPMTSPTARPATAVP